MPWPAWTWMSRRARSSASSARTAQAKTTTLRMLVTLLKPTAGTATVAGYDVVKESVQVRRSIGYCSQVGSTLLRRLRR